MAKRGHCSRANIAITHANGRWLLKEQADLHTQISTDIAMSLSDKTGNIDLLEVFCSPTSQLTHTAHNSGMDAERWTSNDFDRSTVSGYQQAAQRLRELRPKRLWLSPERGPFSSMQNDNQRTPNQIAELA